MTHSRFEERHNRLEFGENSCKFCFGGKDAPEAPDLSGLAATSEYAAELGFATAMEQLEWARTEWAEQKELIYSVLDVQMPIMMEQWDIAKQQWEWAKEDRDRYEKLYQPLEEDLIKEFQDYASPERMELEAGRAAADVTRAFQAQRENAQRQLESYGIDPSQTRSQALDANMRAQEAAAQAGAENAARKRVEDVGRALRSEALNIGRGMPAQTAQSVATALQGGQSAAGIGQGAIGGYSGAYGTAAGSMGSPTQWFGQGMGGLNQSANIQSAGYQNQLAGWQAGQQYDPLNLALYGGGMMIGNKFFADGGEVDGPGGPKDDTIPARLSDGEFVIPAEVVERKGTEFFDKLISKTREDPAVQKRLEDMRAMALPPPDVTNPGLPIPQENMLADGGQPEMSKALMHNRYMQQTGQFNSPSQLRSGSLPDLSKSADWGNMQTSYMAPRGGIPTTIVPAPAAPTYTVPAGPARPAVQPPAATSPGKTEAHAGGTQSYLQGLRKSRLDQWGNNIRFGHGGGPNGEWLGPNAAPANWSGLHNRGSLGGSLGGEGFRMVTSPQGYQMLVSPQNTDVWGNRVQWLAEGGPVQKEPTASDRWQAIREKYRGTVSSTNPRSESIRNWMIETQKARPAIKEWRGRMLAETGPGDRRKAQEWINANPGQTMEGTFKPDTWEYAAQLYQQRPGPGSLFQQPVFQQYQQKYGITPPGPGHMRV